MKRPSCMPVASVVALALGGCASDTGGQADAAPRDTAAPSDAPHDVAEALADTHEACAPGLEGRTRCSDGQLASCIAGVWELARCPGATVCDDGACLPASCTAGDASCADDRTRRVCNPTGTRWIDVPCAEGVCRDGACTEGCVAGERRCDGSAVLECQTDFSEAIVATCVTADGELCRAGRCLTACEVMGTKRGYVGCDYWAADLPNDASAIDNIFAFAFSNVSATKDAAVTVTSPWGTVQQVTVPAGDLATHKLPVPRWLSQITTAGIGRFGFRIESDQPIAAWMFNPLERYDVTAEATVATNDASILIPAPSLGTSYLAVTWSDPGEYSGPPYVTVIATRDDTKVTVTPTETIPIAQSPYLLVKGAAATVTLDAYETLNLEPPALPKVRSDMTGTRIESDTNTVAVFSGNRCARVPDIGRFCDHIETQLPALEAWGDSFVVAKFTDRGGEADYFRVVAQVDGTVLTFDPPLASGPEAPTLQAGAFWQFASKSDFALTSNHPILLAQFMASESMTTPPGPFGVSEYCPPEIGGTCQGDPALVLPAPVAQWRADQIFLGPDTYQHQFISVVFAAGTTMTLDGVAVDTSLGRTVGSAAWRAVTLPTSGGRRTLVGSAPLGVIVYGFDHNISYAYNGGLDFRNLRLPPPP